jgi:IS30 family transposase
MTQKLLELFRAPHNMDTAAIARKLGKSESWVYAAIHRERCLEKGDTAHEDAKEQQRAATQKERQRRRQEYLKNRDRRKEHVRIQKRTLKALIMPAGVTRQVWVEQ